MKTKKKWHKVLSIVLCLAICLSLMSTTVLAGGTDTRTEINTVVATSNLQVPKYGESVISKYNHTWTVTTGSQVTFTNSNSNWQKKNGDTWETYTGAVFTEGTYRFYVQVRVDSTTLKLGDSLSVTVDGNTWTLERAPYVCDTYSYVYIDSPEYTVTETDIPFSVTDDSKYDITTNYVNTPITAFSISDSVAGGKKPYVYTKQSGPSWINVSSDGTVSGTPVATGSNSNLVIRVTDNNGQYQDLTIAVGDTSPDPANRTDVNTIVATSNLQVPKYGESVISKYDHTWTVTTGSQATFSNSTSNWQKKNGDTWETYTGTTFTEGTYRFYVQIRVDGTYGNTHKLGNSLSVTVDGNTWTLESTPYVYYTYSYVFVDSPEYTVTVPDTTQYTVTFDMNGHGKTPDAQTVASGEKVTAPTAPTAEGYTFGGWYKEAACTNAWNFETDTVSGFTTLYAYWYKPIEKITLTVNVEGGKVIDQIPSYTVEPEGAIASADLLKWYVSDTGTDEEAPFMSGASTVSGLFETGKYYYPSFVVMLASGYKVDDSTVWEIVNTASEQPNDKGWILAEAASSYNVHFSYNNQNIEAEDVTVAAGEKVTEPAAPTVEGYELAGWYDASSYIGKIMLFKQGTDPADVFAPFDFSTPITHDTLLVARWIEKGHTVTFEMNGIGTAPDAQTVEDGEKASEPAAPTADGYVFGGWYTDSACSTAFDFTAAITEDTTVFAKWTPIYTVTFEMNGIGTAPGTQTVKDGEKASEPAAPTAEGYTFGGWYKEATCTNAWNFETDTVTEATTLFAKWTANNCIVTFDSRGGSAVASQTVAYGSKVTKPDDPTMARFDFAGWYTDKTYSTPFNFDTAISGNITLVAKWTTCYINLYTSKSPYGKVSLGETDYKGDIVYQSQILNNANKSGTTFTAYAQPNDGYKFKEWQDADGNTVSTDQNYTSTRTSSRLDLYAIFEQSTYAVTFDLNGRGTTAPDAQTVEINGKVTKPADPTYSTFDFVGWYKEAACTNAWNFETDTVTEATTLYAKWTTCWVSASNEKSPYGTVSVNGTQWGDFYGNNNKAGTTFTAYAQPNDGYKFKEWQDRDGNIVSTDQTYTGTRSYTTEGKNGDLILYAIFEPITYTVTFDENGHGTAPDGQTVVTGKTASKPDDPSAIGWYFDGWYTDEDCSEEFDFAAAITDDTTVFAKWTEVKYTVVSGADGTWTKDSGKDYEITVKRNVADETCYDHFTSVEMDGTELTAGTDYTAKAGGTIVTLKGDALQKLADGAHTITVNFDDGKTQTGITINAAETEHIAGTSDQNTTGKTGSSSTTKSDNTKPVMTGDSNQMMMWIVLMLIALAGVGAMAVYADRKRMHR